MLKKKNDVLVSSRNDPWQFCKIFLKLIQLLIAIIEKNI